MRVECEHKVDASEAGADGSHEYFYEYDLYRFIDGDLTLVARSYIDEPRRAYFLRTEHHGQTAFLDVDDLRGALAQQARSHLAARGKSEFFWLDPRCGGYVALEAT
jgi:hypothetical protein